MDEKRVIQSQYLAALDMLRRAVEHCPDSLWDDSKDKKFYKHKIRPGSASMGI